MAKIAGPQPFLDHMAAHHIPGVLLPLVILLELSAGGMPRPVESHSQAKVSILGRCAPSR